MIKYLPFTAEDEKRMSALREIKLNSSNISKENIEKIGKAIADAHKEKEQEKKILKPNEILQLDDDPFL